MGSPAQPLSAPIQQQPLLAAAPDTFESISARNGGIPVDFFRYPPDVQKKALMLVNYQAPATGYMLTRNAQWAAAADAAAVLDPNFNTALYDTRRKTQVDFTSGPTSKNLTSLNQTIGHLRALREKGDELKNAPFVPWNDLANWYEQKRGHPEVGNFNLAGDAVASELTRVFRGTGGNEADVMRFKKELSSSGSPDQIHGAVDMAMDLLASRIAALKQQYENGMGKTMNIRFFSPKAKALIQGLGYDPDLLEHGELQKINRSQPAQQQPAQVQPQSDLSNVPTEELMRRLTGGK